MEYYSYIPKIKKKTERKERIGKRKIKKKILAFVTVWMDLENIMLSEINESEKDKYHMISLICGI